MEEEDPSLRDTRSRLDDERLGGGVALPEDRVGAAHAADSLGHGTHSARRGASRERNGRVHTATRGGPGRGRVRLDLYAGKSAIVARLDPVVAALAERGVAPDTVTIAAVPVAALGGAALLLSPSAPALLLLVPILAAIRLILNLLDGALARRSGRSHPRGELLNELGDRLADIAFLAPVAVLPGASPVIVLAGVIGALLASYVGITTRAAGGQRIYRGILSKPGRMVLVSVAAVAAFAIGPVAWMWFGPLLVLGAGLTLLERLVVAFRQLA